jgi:hypothetical protein
MNTTRRGFARDVAGLALAGQVRGAADDFYRELVRANDSTATAAIAQLGTARTYIRRVGEQVEALAAAYCCPESSLFKSEQLNALLERAAGILVQAQHPDGTIDAGNLHSPPDTGFVVQTVATALAVLRQTRDSRLDKAHDLLGKFILAAGEALVTGGVHTPNHRWVISSALARINSLFPAAKYVERIDDWLGEGVYIAEDGQFAERSTGIYSRVEDDAFITMARLLNRRELLEPVRRNLDMTIYYAHPDGELETVGSRRQDQNMVAYLAGYYLEYRYLAVRDRNPLYAAVARMIEQQMGDRVKRLNPLIYFLEEPLLKTSLPEGGAIPLSYAKVFANTGLVRIRRGAISATVYGGSDWPLGIASGRASNPTFFSFREGKAVLESVRMGAAFFSEGVFRSKGLAAHDNRYSLHQRFDVPYYQPLAKKDRNARGDYPLTPVADARFWSKLNFPARRVSNVQTLEQKVTVVENAGTFELQFDISGHDRVPFTVELAFRPGGAFEGAVEERTKGRTFVLKEGMGRYRAGEDVIEFGPGQVEHERFDMSGSSYVAHGAHLQTSGYCVYITGFTPFRKTLTIRAVA